MLLFPLNTASQVWQENETIILQQCCRPCNALLPEAAPHSDSGSCQLCCRPSTFLLHNQIPPEYSSPISAFPVSHWGTAYVPLRCGIHTPLPLHHYPVHQTFYSEDKDFGAASSFLQRKTTILICTKRWAMAESESRRVFGSSIEISSALPRKLGEDISLSFLPSAAWPEFEVVQTNTQKISMGKRSPSQTFGWQEKWGFTSTKQTAKLTAKFWYIN